MTTQGTCLPLSSGARSYAAKTLPPPNAELNPVVPKVRRLCDEGKAGEAAVVAFDAILADTIRLYGLKVPPSCTSFEFLARFLRPDMGKLLELLPDLYRLYEPARFGGIVPGDAQSVRTVVDRIYTETSLAWAYDPLYQPKGPGFPSSPSDAAPSPGSPPGGPKRS